MILFIIFSLAIASATAISGGESELNNPTETGRIYNGTQAVTAEFPYMVSVAIGGAHVCGGFIYNERFVVTAASCISGISTTQLLVYVSLVSLISPDPGEQIIPVKNTWTFDGYNNVTKLHDLGLIEVSRPFVFSVNITFLRYEAIDELAEKNGKIMGWGATQQGGLAYTRLRKAIVTILPTDCRTYGNDEYNSAYMLCVGAEGDSSQPCQFDEGGPLVQMTQEGERAIGIFSKNKGCPATPYSPSIYTRLSSYYPWLIKIAGQQPATNK